VLGRDPNAGEMSAATQALSLGETRTQLALLVLNSAEYRSNEIGSDYAAFLHRAPGQSETSSWLSLLGAGASDEALAAQLIGSAEYYANRGNSSSDGFLSAMYCDAVSRAIDQFSQNNDDAALGAATSRTTITTSLLSSAEYRKQLVGDYYLRYLRRAGSPSELAFFAGLMGSGESDEQVIAAILGSSEYFSLFNPVVAVAKTSVARGGTITTTLSRFATLKLTVLRVLPTGHARDLSHTVDLTIPAPATRRVGVVNFGGHAKGRVKLRWNRKVGRKRLKRGQYLLLLTAYRGHRQIGTSDPLPFTVH
jgi:hypothetical protein